MRYASFILSFLLAFSLTILPAHAGHPVKLKPATELSSNSIRLSDVFDGVPEDIDREIALAPSAGESVTYDVRILSNLASNYRLEWEARSYSDHTLLTRAAHFLTLDEVRPEILSQLEAQGINKNTNYEILFDNRSFSLALPAEHAPEFKIINFIYDKSSRRFKADIIAKTQASSIQRPLTGRVIVKKNIPVLTKRMNIGDIISKYDLAWNWVQENKIGSDVLLNDQDIIGQEVRQGLVTGSMIRARDVAEPRLIQRGALVTMKIHTPVMLITAQGRALQDGAKGDSVRVKNLQSNRVIEGVVTADGVIQVQTGSVEQLAAL